MVRPQKVEFPVRVGLAGIEIPEKEHGKGRHLRVAPESRSQRQRFRGPVAQAQPGFGGKGPVEREVLQVKPRVDRPPFARPVLQLRETLDDGEPPVEVAQEVEVAQPVPVPVGLPVAIFHAGGYLLQFRLYAGAERAAPREFAVQVGLEAIPHGAVVHVGVEGAVVQRLVHGVFPVGVPLYIGA